MNRAEYIQKLEDDRKAFYAKVDSSRRIDDSFALETDIPLTEDEINKINEFWKPYQFAYPTIDYKSFQTFKNRNELSTIDDFTSEKARNIIQITGHGLVSEGGG